LRILIRNKWNGLYIVDWVIDIAVVNITNCNFTNLIRWSNNEYGGLILLNGCSTSVLQLNRMYVDDVDISNSWRDGEMVRWWSDMCFKCRMC
jgi:hypothetical protein